MTDREAIRRLASMVAVLSGRVVCWEVEERAAALENELLAEPAAPAVTRDEAEGFVSLVHAVWGRYHHYAPPSLSEMPAFFRVVADALDREA